MAEFKNICISFGDKTVFDNYSLSLPDKKTTVIMGPSGCGKSTLLKVAAGIIKPQKGSFESSGKIGYMFQEPRLLPWKSARNNVYAVLKKSDYPIGDKYLDLVGLSDSLHKSPLELSGGMKQRLSFARCLSYAEAEDCKLIMLDEPFSALDSDLKNDMIALFLNAVTNITALVVTHDEHEAYMIGDNILKL